MSSIILFCLTMAMQFVIAWWASILEFLAVNSMPFCSWLVALASTWICLTQGMWPSIPQPHCCSFLLHNRWLIDPCLDTSSSLHWVSAKALWLHFKPFQYHWHCCMSNHVLSTSDHINPSSKTYPSPGDHQGQNSSPLCSYRGRPSRLWVKHWCNYVSDKATSVTVI